MNRSIGEIKGGVNEDFGKAILKEKIKRMQNNKRECSDYEMKNKVYAIWLKTKSQ